MTLPCAWLFLTFPAFWHKPLGAIALIFLSIRVAPSHTDYWLVLPFQWFQNADLRQTSDEREKNCSKLKIIILEAQITERCWKIFILKQLSSRCKKLIAARLTDLKIKLGFHWVNMKQYELIFGMIFLFHVLKLNSCNFPCKNIKYRVRTNFRTTKFRNKQRWYTDTTFV